jgi:ATP-dependent DNA ligase
VFLAELIYGAGKNFYDFARNKLTDELSLVVFDCLRLNGVDIYKTQNYAARRKICEQQTFYTPRVILVPRQIVTNRAEFDTYYNKIVAQGFEGVVAKYPTSMYFTGEQDDWTKVKHEADCDLAVIGYQTATKTVKNLSLYLGHMVSGQIVPLTHCGGGITNDLKTELLGKLQAKRTHTIKDDHFVKPEMVVTITHNGTVYNADGTVSSLRHPRFKCVREDKTISQIDEVV